MNFFNVLSAKYGKAVMFAFAFFIHLSQLGYAQDISFESIRKVHRINAHGDEFMAIDLSADGKWIVVGTEKGELIIWNIAEGKIEKRFSQKFPIHAVKFLKDGQNVIGAGGEHIGKHNCSLGKWNILTGRFQPWADCGDDSLLYLGGDLESGLIATSDAMGYATVWNGETGKRVSVWNTKRATLGLAVLDKTLYLSQTSKELIEKLSDEDESFSVDINKFSIDPLKKSEAIFVTGKNDRILTTIEFSPDKKMLAVRGVEDDEYRYFIFDRKMGTLLTSFEAYLAKWISNEKLLVSDSSAPNEIVRITNNGETQSEVITKGGGFRSSGSPANMTGHVVSEDGSKVWATFQIGGFLTEFDLKTKSGNTLISSNSFPFTMDVVETGNANGYAATGGDDKFVRIWNLADLSLAREFQTNPGVPQGVAFVDDGQKVVFSSSTKEAPTSIFAADLKAGEIKNILNVEQPFVSVRSAGKGFVYNSGNKLVVASAEDGSKTAEYEFAEGISKFDTSANAKFLVVADKKGVLWAIDLTNGERKKSSGDPIEDLTKITISNDGKKVYTTEFSANLRLWETDSQKSKVLNDFRGQASFVKLSADEKFILIGGNHHDIGVYEAETGEGVFYTRDESSDFYVTNGWMKGNRLIYTTDGGVMVDGLFSK